MATTSIVDEQPEAEAKALPKTARLGIGLCLSGGGYRATLFHLGGLRRLNELGILARDDFRTVTSVSGGSITAAWLATALARNPDLAEATTAIPTDRWDREVWAPLRAFTRKNIRTAPVLKRLLPWNWFRDDTAVRGPRGTLRERPHFTPSRTDAGSPQLRPLRHGHGLRRELGLRARTHGRLPGRLQEAARRGVCPRTRRGRVGVLPTAFQPALRRRDAAGAQGRPGHTRPRA